MRECVLTTLFPFAARQVMTPDGQRVQVPVPNGVAPGGQFQVQYQPIAAAQPMQAMPVAQPMAAGVVMGTAAMVAPQPMQMQMQPMQMQMQPAVAHVGPPPPPGCPPGGVWQDERYCGAITCLFVVIVPMYALCSCCCPLDTRRVYKLPDGRKYDMNGNEIVEQGGDSD